MNTLLLSHRTRIGLLTATFLAVLLPLRCAAIVMDWSTLTWPTDINGNPLMTASFDVDPNNPGNDVTISITGDTAAFATGFPVINTTPITGGTAADSGLQLVLTYPNTASNITVTVSFTYAGNGYAYGVDQAQLTLFDIDKGTSGAKTVYVDQISNIQANNVNTSSAVAATITNIPGSPTYTVANNGTLGATITGNANNPDTSGKGNATLNFGTNIIDSLSFTYGNGPGVNKGPNQQAIAVFDISYRPRMPEKDPAWAAVALCGLVLGYRAVRSRFPRTA
jgi:hypothetical protein